MRIRTTRLPAGYREVAYIESTGTQTLDLGITAANKRFEIDLQFTSNSPRQLMGIYGSSTEYFGINGSGSWELIGNSNNVSTLQRCVVIYDVGILSTQRTNTWIKGSTTKYLGQVNPVSNFDVYAARNFNLFRLATLGYNCRMKLFGTEVYDSTNALINNFIPCVRESDNSTGVYDILNGIFRGTTAVMLTGERKDTYRTPIIIPEGTTNLITSIGATQNCTKSGNGVLIDWTTAETSKDTYFFFNLSESIQQNTTYTLSFTVEGLTQSGVSWKWSNFSEAQYKIVIKNGRNSLTFTTGTNNSAFFDDLQRYTVKYKMYNFQLEKKDHATPFVDGTRPDNYLQSCRVAELMYGYNQLWNPNRTAGQWKFDLDIITQWTVFTGTSTSPSSYDNNLSTNSSHKYYVKFIKDLNDATSIVKLIFNKQYSDGVKSYEGIVSNVNTIGYVWGYSANVSYTEHMKLQIIDLTDWYGAGREPTTVAEFTEKFPNDYYGYLNPRVLLTKGMINELPLYGYNQWIANGNFAAGTSGWSGHGGAIISVTNKIMNIRPTGDLSNFGLRENLSTSMVVGHKILATYTARITSGSASLRLRFPSLVDAPALTGTFKTLYFIGTVESTANSTFLLQSINGSGTVSIDIKDVWLVDLTDWYGSGNEPSTAAEFTATFPHKYYECYRLNLLNKYMINMLGSN